jgi:hypothetical protein
LWVRSQNDDAKDKNAYCYVAQYKSGNRHTSPALHVAGLADLAESDVTENDGGYRAEQFQDTKDRDPEEDDAGDAKDHRGYR